MFKGRHFDRSVILLRVRSYLAYGLSLRDPKEMMAERTPTPPISIGTGPLTSPRDLGTQVVHKLWRRHSGRVNFAARSKI